MTRKEKIKIAEGILKSIFENYASELLRTDNTHKFIYRWVFIKEDRKTEETRKAFREYFRVVREMNNKGILENKWTKGGYYLSSKSFLVSEVSNDYFTFPENYPLKNGTDLHLNLVKEMQAEYTRKLNKYIMI